MCICKSKLSVSCKEVVCSSVMVWMLMSSQRWMNELFLWWFWVHGGWYSFYTLMFFLVRLFFSYIFLFPMFFFLLSASAPLFCHFHLHLFPATINPPVPTWHYASCSVEFSSMFSQVLMLCIFFLLPLFFALLFVSVNYLNFHWPTQAALHFLAPNSTRNFDNFLCLIL